MNLKLLNLYLLIFWTFVGLALLFRDYLVPDRAINPARETQLNMLAYVALALAAWNLVRWWVTRNNMRRRAAAEAVYEHHVGPPAAKGPPAVTDPQFQFDRPDIPPPPPPNGSSRH